MSTFSWNCAITFVAICNKPYFHGWFFVILNMISFVYCNKTWPSLFVSQSPELKLTACATNLKDLVF